MGQKQWKSSTNPSWFFAVVSLALAHSLHGYEGPTSRKRGALAWRALDVDGPMVGHNDFAHDIEPRPVHSEPVLYRDSKRTSNCSCGDGTASIAYLDDTMGGSCAGPVG